MWRLARGQVTASVIVAFTKQDKMQKALEQQLAGCGKWWDGASMQTLVESSDRNKNRGEQWCWSPLLGTPLDWTHVCDRAWWRILMVDCGLWSWCWIMTVKVDHDRDCGSWRDGGLWLYDNDTRGGRQSWMIIITTRLLTYTIDLLA